MIQMRAAAYDRFGGPEVLYETKVDVPVLRDNEVLVKVEAASVNGFDVGARSGALKIMTGRKFPQRTGLDFAGEVVEAASSASPFQRGDQVWGSLPLHQVGSVAEFVTIQPAHLARIPSSLDSTAAAALPVVGSTVITALRDMGRLVAGQRLLVRGASGGVGSIAIQLGRALGAHVTGLASAGNLRFVRDLGAEVALDYASARPDDLEAFDVILDTVGSHASAWRKRLTRKGRMMAIVPDLKHPLMSMAYFAWSHIYGEQRVRYFSDKPDTQLLTDLANYVDSGAIRPIIDKVHALSDISEAHRAMQAGGRKGKQVIRLA